MIRYLVFAYCFVIILMTGNAQVFANDPQGELQMPTGSMTIKAPLKSTDKRTPVTFSHSKHFNQSCISCHHEWDRVSPVQGCSSAGCHEKVRPCPPSGKPSEKKQIISLTGAYHRACRGCHRTYSKELEILNKQKNKAHEKVNLEAAPVACEGCHPATAGSEVVASGSFTIPLRNITIEAPEGAYTRKSSVDFPHAAHFYFSCQSCHHDWDGSSQIKNCTTSGCHDQLEPDEKTRNINAPENNRYFMAAYHKGCIKCHRTLLKERNKLEQTGAMSVESLPEPGPAGCNGCHP